MMNKYLNQVRKLIAILFEWIRQRTGRQKTPESSDPSTREWIRRNPKNSRSLLIFVHGFNGHYRQTWHEFPDMLFRTPEIQNLDILLWGYPTQLFRFRNQPSIKTIGKLFLTELKLLSRDYDTIVIAGHSMGGLVIRSSLICAIEQNQHAVMSTVRQIVLYGTPNEGIMIARHVPEFLSSQIADMDATSQFIRTLNREWIHKGLICPANNYGVRVTAVSGVNDDFVPETSAFAFFSETETVRGDHVTMVKPANRLHNSYRVLLDRIRIATQETA